MPILYLDEDIKREIVDLLITPDISVRTTREERRPSASDPFQLAYAAEQGWVNVTCNRNDYHLLHDAWLLWSHRWEVAARHSGILALDQGVMAAAITAMLATGLVLTTAMYDWMARDGMWHLYHP